MVYGVESTACSPNSHFVLLPEWRRYVEAKLLEVVRPKALNQICRRPGELKRRVRPACPLGGACNTI